ncbi:MAG: fibronectin type III domain-containing protein [Nitrospirae bacterium]|nr:fibronectin type III domain-containing protein [Nitrospirota bacterium]
MARTKISMAGTRFTLTSIVCIILTVLFSGVAIAAPVINQTAPLDSQKFAASTTTIPISGTITDTAGLKQLTLSSSKGWSKTYTLSGTKIDLSAYSFDVTGASGNVTLTTTAQNGNGETKSLSIVVSINAAASSCIPAAPNVMIYDPPMSVTETYCAPKVGINPNCSAVTSTKLLYGTSSGNLNQTGSIIPTYTALDKENLLTAGMINLSPNTTYYYKVVAGNALGTTESQVTTCKTLASTCSQVAAPTVKLYDPWSVTENNCYFQVGITPNCSAVTTTKLVYGTTSDNLNQTGSIVPAYTALDKENLLAGVLMNLSPNTTYFYKVAAGNANGTTESQVGTCKTLASQCSQVAAPTVKLYDPYSITETMCLFKVGITPNCSSIKSGTFYYGTTASNLNLSGQVYIVSQNADKENLNYFGPSSLQPNTTYYYKVVIVSDKGTTETPIASCKTLTSTCQTPPAINNVSVQEISASGSKITASVNAKGGTAVVTVMYGTTQGGLTSASSTVSVSGSTDTPVSIALSGLSPNTTYYYKVSAKNEAGTTESSILTFKTSGSTASRYALTVVNSGSGTGTVTPGSGSYDANTVVTLTSTAASGSTFAGWSADCNCTGTTTTCSVTMSAAKTCVATFNVPTYALTINKAGTGTGSVSTSPATGPYIAGTKVTLTETAASGSTFAGWSGGGCTGTTSTCTVTMSTATTVTATFNVQAAKLPPTIAENVTSQSITANSATIQGQVNPKDSTTIVYVMYGINSGSMTTKSSQVSLSGISQQSVSIVLSNLTANTTYSYKLVASNSAGTQESKVFSFKTSTK